MKQRLETVRSMLELQRFGWRRESGKVYRDVECREDLGLPYPIKIMI